MIAGTPDIKNFFETLNECVDCKFNEKFSKYADYLSIAKIEDAQFISGRLTSKNVDYVSDNIGQEFFEVTLGSKESVTTIVRFTYTQFRPQFTVEQEVFMFIFRDCVANKIAVNRLSDKYSYIYNNDIEFGMHNANYLFTRFDEMFASGVATKYSVAFINIKHVNQLNRYFGSDIAGSAIKMFGAKLNAFPDADRGEFAAHLGGDNFVVVIITSRLTELEHFISSVPVSLTYGGDKFEHIFSCRAGITSIRPNHRFGNHVMGECSQAYSYSKKNNLDIVYYSEAINESNHNNTETLSRALDIQSWQAQGISIIPITVNFSGRHLFNSSVADNILEVIDKYGVDHKLIGIEFSEPDFTQRMPVLKDVSHTLSEAGVLVTLDKFSTGQSTLTLLHDMEASYVKISADRFDPDDPKGRIIANDMINLANTLGYKVICEGVESQKQADDLMMCGCKYFQSFFYDKPLSERFFVSRLQDPDYDIEIAKSNSEEK